VEIDFAAASEAQRYKLLAGLVVPRPIALVTTRSPEGVDNAAPISFFNALSEEPALIVLSFGANRAGRIKDSERLIRETGEFVVHLVDEAMAPEMHFCSADFPPGESEVDAAGLAMLPCRVVKARRIARAPVAMECRVHTLIEPAPGRTIVLGEVLWMHVSDAIIDPVTLRVDREAYRTVGRLEGRSYMRTRDRFELPIADYQAWRASQQAAGED